MLTNRLLNQIDEIESFEALENITTPKLRTYQALDLLRLLIVKKFIVMYDTGKGKTFMAAGLFKALKNSGELNKGLFIVPNNNIDVLCDTIKSATGLKAKLFTEKHYKTFNDDDIENNDVIVITHGCMSTPIHLKALSIYRKRFNAVVVDELHKISNFTHSHSGFALYSLLQNTEYSLGLTATPITTDVIQLAKAMYIINRDVVKDWKSLANDLGMYKYNAFDQTHLDMFIVRQRDENNHRGFKVQVNPHTHQINAEGQFMFQTTKGPGAINQAEKVVELIKERPNKKCAIYCRLKENQKFLNDYLISKGIPSVIINGDNSRKSKNELAGAFRGGDYTAVITNIVESVDLTCDFIIMYELTSLAKQFEGRGERTEESKHLDIFFIITRNTGEEEFFYKNIYRTSQEIQEILLTDMKEFVHTENY